jgi:hypothetical protein
MALPTPFARFPFRPEEFGQIDTCKGINAALSRSA